MKNAMFLEELQQYRQQAEAKAATVLAKLRKEAEKKYFKNLDKVLQILLDDVANFRVENLDLDDSPAIDKYSHKIYEAVTNVLADLNNPTAITLRSLEKYHDDIKNGLVSLDETFKKYIKLLDPTFTKKVKTLNKSYLRVLKELKKFDDFIQKKYLPKSEIEKSVWIIDEVVESVHAVNKRIEIILSKEEEVNAKTDEISQMEVELANLKNHELRQKYATARQQFAAIQKELDDQLSDIRKALRKYINKQSKTKNAGDLSLMKDFVSDAATTLAEQKSLGSIIAILKTIDDLLENNKLELKKERKITARHNIKVLLDGKLDEMWKVAQQSYDARISLEKQLEELELDKMIAKVEDSQFAAKRDQKRLIEREYREAMNYVDEIIKNQRDIEELLQVKFTEQLSEIPSFDLEIT